MSISNDEIYAVLLGIKQDIGTITAQTASQAMSLASHVKDDAELLKRVGGIELDMAQRQGAERTWRRITTFATAALGAVSGSLGTLFMKGHH